MELQELVSNKKILFITTKNIDYIRNTQELRILSKYADSVEIVCSEKENYVLRIFDVWKKTSSKRVKECDAIFVGFEPQFIIPYVGYKFKNKPVYIDFFISVYDTLIMDRKKFKDNSIFARYFHHIDEKTLRLADHVITDTKAHEKFFIEEFKGENNKFETIYLEADPSIYYPREKQKPEELRDKLVVLYFGSILPIQGVNTILDAIREFQNDNDVFFDIIGPIPEEYDKPVQDNVRYTTWLSQEELAGRISQADLCLAGHFNGKINKARRTIAGKTYIYEMMGKRMILGDGEANRELFIEDSRHIYVEMGNAGSLAIAIRKEKINCENN